MRFREAEAHPELDGTTLPFDQDKLRTYFWDDAGTRDGGICAYRDWLDRHSELRPWSPSNRAGSAPKNPLAPQPATFPQSLQRDSLAAYSTRRTP